VAQEALEAYKGRAVRRPIGRAICRRSVRTTASDLLSEAARSNQGASVSVSWHDLDSGISFRHFGGYLPNVTIFSKIAQAIRNEEVVEMLQEARCQNLRNANSRTLAFGVRLGSVVFARLRSDSQRTTDFCARPNTGCLSNDR